MIRLDCRLMILAYEEKWLDLLFMVLDSCVIWLIYEAHHGLYFD